MRTKTILVYGCLIAATAWPAFHVALVRRYDVSPWKLAGWGMYTTPRFDRVDMEVYGRDTAANGWVQITAPSATLRIEANRFLQDFRWLRRLAGTRRLVAAALADHPTWRELRVEVFDPILTRDTGMVRKRRTTFHHPSGRVVVDEAPPTPTPE